MNNKKVRKFLEKQGFVDHPAEKHKMILHFNSRGGLIVFECGSSYEVILGYLADDITPELIFSDVTEKTLIERFDSMKKISTELFAKLLSENY